MGNDFVPICSPLEHTSSGDQGYQSSDNILPLIYDIFDINGHILSLYKMRLELSSMYSPFRVINEYHFWIRWRGIQTESLSYNSMSLIWVERGEKIYFINSPFLWETIPSNLEIRAYFKWSIWCICPHFKFNLNEMRSELSLEFRVINEYQAFLNEHARNSKFII